MYNLVELFFRAREISKTTLYSVDEQLETRLKILLTLFLTHVLPSWLNIGNGSLVDGINIWSNYWAVHVSIQFLILDRLHFDSVFDVAPKLHNLLNELWSQLIILQLVKRLKHLFIGQGSNHGAAISILEKRGQKSPDSIFFFSIFSKSRLRSLSFF